MPKRVGSELEKMFVKKIPKKIDNLELPSSDDEVLITVTVTGRKYFYHKSFMYLQTVSFFEYVVAKCTHTSCPSWGINIKNVYYVCKFHNHEANGMLARLQIFLTILEQLSRHHPKRTLNSLFNKTLGKMNLGVLFTLPPEFGEAMLRARKVPQIYEPYIYNCRAEPFDIGYCTSSLTPELVLQRLQASVNESFGASLNINMYETIDLTNQSHENRPIKHLKIPEHLQDFFKNATPNESRTVLYIQNSDLQPREAIVLETPECVRRVMLSESENMFLLNYAEPDMAENFIKFYNTIHQSTVVSPIQQNLNLEAVETSETLPDIENSNQSSAVLNDDKEPVFDPEQILGDNKLKHCDCLLGISENICILGTELTSNNRNELLSSSLNDDADYLPDKPDIFGNTIVDDFLLPVWFTRTSKSNESVEVNEELHELEEIIDLTEEEFY